MTLGYTASQAEAIESDDAALHIVACAGSGKTQVLAERVVTLLGRDGIKPNEIVAFTFTDRAAAELQERTHRLVSDRFGDVVGLAEMFVGTMHAYCLDLLQTHAFEYLKYSVLNEPQSRLFVDRYSRRCGLASVTVKEGPSAGTQLSRFKDTRLFMRLMGVMREDTVIANLVPDDVLSALEQYEDLLREKRFLDYTSIISLLVRLLESNDPSPLLHHVTTLRHVIVDEYQDVNPLQQRLIEALTSHGAHICVVGDDDQTIYQWRGSAVRNIIDFPNRHPNVHQVTLAENFRSSYAVVDLARQVAEVNTTTRLPKAMLSASHQTFERGDLLALQFNTEAEEATWLCDRIEQLRGTPFQDAPASQRRGLSWSDCAILLRSVVRNAEPIVMEMRQRGIPHLVKGMTGLFDNLEVIAARESFLYIVERSSTQDVAEAWRRALPHLSHDQISRAQVVLDAARDWSGSQRWSSYNIQRTYLDVLESLDLREGGDDTPGAGELVYYNLGKFSQAISDFEQINFQSEPQQKYTSFADWLIYQAPNLYEESDASAGYAQPDAVTITTVHQAKGMQWPAVFIPVLRRNSFPSSGGGGRSIWHLMPSAAIIDADRYRGGVEDERRLFYVALTRSQKYLACTWAPGQGTRARRPSDFFVEVTNNSRVLTRPVSSLNNKITPRARIETPEVVISFSELKYLFECPYQFKLRFLYGFNAPLHEALGFGKSVHDALSELHKRVLMGEAVGTDDVEGLVDRHLHVPFAYPTLREHLRESAVNDVLRYMRRQGPEIARTMHSELPVRVTVAPGVTVDGRIDLIRKLDTDEISVVDFKSTERAQPEAVTRDQLHVYALGYEELTGTRPDLIEVLNLDSRAKSTRELVDHDLLRATAVKIEAGGERLRDNDLPRLTSWCQTCSSCDLAGICRTKG